MKQHSLAANALVLLLGAWQLRVQVCSRSGGHNQHPNLNLNLMALHKPLLLPSSMHSR